MDGYCVDGYCVDGYCVDGYCVDGYCVDGYCVAMTSRLPEFRHSMHDAANRSLLTAFRQSIPL